MDKTLTDAITVANHHGLTDRDLVAVVEAATAARRAEDERPGMVPMTHPGLPPQLVDPDAVPVYEQSGWRQAAVEPIEDAAPVVDEAPDAKPSKAAAKKETP